VWREKAIVKTHEMLVAPMITPLEDASVLSGILCVRLTLTATFYMTTATLLLVTLPLITTVATSLVAAHLVLSRLTPFIVDVTSCPI
jgi:hypothetical protein